MTNTTFFRELISKKGVSIKSIAVRLGITREGLYNKINNQTEFKASEIVALSNMLYLTFDERETIFFNHEGELNST